MLTRNLLHRIFRHSPRQKVSEDTLPRRFKQPAAERAGPAVEASSGPASPYKERKVAMYTIAPAPKTPEPFGLENIAKEDADDTSSPNDTASLTETLASLELETSTFSARELVRATLDEAKTAATFHLDTINTTLALLEALDGFSNIGPPTGTPLHLRVPAAAKGSSTAEGLGPKKRKLSVDGDLAPNHLCSWRTDALAKIAILSEKEGELIMLQRDLHQKDVETDELKQRLASHEGNLQAIFGYHKIETAETVAAKNKSIRGLE
ncbi:hypothetical protein SLS59_002885 [Nothophoma quercina]|uniref:Uncharacterized protein n=1 Tax=Nothophoma quercina TaxID=749835 RepID=A0ABR3RRX2_9PLEO